MNGSCAGVSSDKVTSTVAIVLPRAPRSSEDYTSTMVTTGGLLISGPATTSVESKKSSSPLPGFSSLNKT